MTWPQLRKRRRKDDAWKVRNGFMSETEFARKHRTGEYGGNR